MKFMKFTAKYIIKCLPQEYKQSYLAWRIIAHDYGHLGTIQKSECRDAQNNPLPWYTYPAIEFLDKLNLSDKTIFEYGSGFSTLYWAKRAKSVITIEDDKVWFDKISPQVPPNTAIHLITDMDRYAAAPRQTPGPGGKYDVIVIDGKERYSCAQVAVSCVNDDGFIILDNADWFPNTVNFLSNAGMIRVDMIGLGPINAYTWNTMFFLKRNLKIEYNPPVPIATHIDEQAKDDHPK
ncbi:MAG: SAM-dependent methyltransferase [Candidatus Sumerlaeota bacterium]|nr:SAM-dependent methyltransferase [Candidatus Sumerlaeota bacterium]